MTDKGNPGFSAMPRLRELLSRHDRLLGLMPWFAAGFVVFAIAIAVIIPQQSGPAALILSLGVAMVLLVVFFATASGQSAARLLSPGAQAQVPAQRQPGFALDALDAVPEAILVTGPHGEAVYGNPAYRSLTQLAGQLGQSKRPALFAQLVGAHPGLSAISYRLTRAARRGDEVFERLPAFEGAHGLCALDVHIHPLAAGQALWRITGQGGKAAVDKAAALSASGLTLLDEAPVGIFAVDGKGRIDYMNSTLRQWLGFGDEAQAIALKDFIPAAARRLLRRKSRGATSTAVKLKTRDGIETAATLVMEWPDEPGQKLARAVVFGAARGQAPAGLARTPTALDAGAGQGLDEMFMAAPFGVARLDAADPGLAIIEDANPALMEMTEGQAKPGAPFLALFAEQEGDGRTGQFANLEGGQSGPFELKLAADGGKTVNLYITTDHGERAIVYIIDMSAWKDLQTRLFQAQKIQVIGQVVAGVAHDLNNVLTTMGGHCDYLLLRHTIGDPSYPDLQKINENIARSAALVDNLLAYSRKKIVRAVPLNLTAVLTDFTYMLKRILHDNVLLEVEHGRNLPIVRIDKGQIEMAVMNLAINARDAMLDQGGGTLTIRTSRQEDIPARVCAGEAPPQAGAWALVEVIDTGTGMSQEVLDKIFEPFFTTKDIGKGTGLGLANVLGIIRQSGGFLFPVSAPGKGTTFQIWLPECPDPVIEDTPAPKERKPRDLAGQGRILFVEDEDGLRSIAVKTLANRGYDVLEAASGEDALKIAKAHAGAIDLVVSDVIMPGMDGPSFVEKARPYLENTRIVFTSGFAEEEFSDVLSREMDVSFLPKPYKLKKLAQKVKEELSPVE